MSIQEEIQTPLGILEIVSTNGVIDRIEVIESSRSEKKTVSQFQKIFDDYFHRVTKTLDLPYNLVGTEFQLRVWQELCKIPYGETKTYSEIAAAIGRPTAYRAVANACGQNKIPLVVPCHRVVGKSNLGGFRWGLAKKQLLLNLEN